jgi:Fe-Mn family superoxide dismutase
MLRTAGAGAAALVLGRWGSVLRADDPKMPFTLPKLPYADDALEPKISAEIMKLHHGTHHQAYVNNLNKAVADKPDLAKMSVEDLLRAPDKLPMDVRQAIINNGGGHYNHTMFWEIMAKPKDGNKATGDVAKAIDEAFGSFDKFQTALSDAAMKRFGSGWAWLVVNKGKLEVNSTANQDCPLSVGQSPLMGIDVWEHAYYLQYKAARADYVKAWWDVVNWEAVNARYKAAKG